MSYAENAEKNNLKYKTRYKNSDLEKILFHAFSSHLGKVYALKTELI